LQALFLAQKSAFCKALHLTGGGWKSEKPISLYPVLGQNEQKNNSPNGGYIKNGDLLW